LTHPEAIVQSNAFATTGRLPGRIPDGWRALPYYVGEDAFREDGTIRPKIADAEEHVVVVDRQRDPVLRHLLEEVKRFSYLPDKEKAKKLLHYCNTLLGPWTMPEDGLDSWTRAYRTAGQGESLLGSFVIQGKGVCFERALLFKILGDELGLNVQLVNGAGSSRQPNTINHAWAEVRIPGDKRPLIYDPRQSVIGKYYDEVRSHVPSEQIPHHPQK